MGGKTKQSQRTKNNVKPSSSGRSAEILNNTLKLDSSIVSPTTGKVLPVLFPTLVPSSPEHGLSPELSICFKKFTKKDPITKTKALLELTELIKTSNVDSVATALPSWAHFYPTLTIDSDRKVREATQLCHGAIIVACGRRVAPQLRRILPAWILACHDDYVPAQTTARQYLEEPKSLATTSDCMQTLDSDSEMIKNLLILKRTAKTSTNSKQIKTFPGAKLEEAFSFCKSEILQLLLDNLMGNADSMLSKKIDEEERAASITRVVCASLRALEQLVRTLAAAHHDWLWETLTPLLHAQACWRLAAHEETRVRGAWYSAMGRIAARFGPQLEPEVGTKLSRALVAQPEQASAVAAERWAAVLLLMHSVPDWPKWLDKKDLLIKRLLSLLEIGGWGEARSLADTLLPLLSQLHREIFTQQFYLTFFNALFSGLKTKPIVNSKSERQWWINIIAECIRYLSIQSDEYVTEVVTYAHRTWLEQVLSVTDDRQKSDLIKTSATNMVSLLKCWLKQSNENVEKYDQLVRNFWQNIGSTILASIDKLSTEQEHIVQVVDDHILLLKAMQKGFMEEVKKRSINFENEDEVKEIKNDKTIECDPAMIGRFKHNMEDLVSRVCCQYFTFAKEKQVSRAVFPSLYNLLLEFDSEAMFVRLAKHVDADSVYGLYEKELRAWLAGDTMRCRTLVDIVFMAAKYLSGDEQDRMFNSFQQFPPSVVEWCVVRALSPPRVPSAFKWLHSNTVDASLVSLCRREEDDAAVALLLRCVTPDDQNGDILVSEATVNKIMQMYGEALSDAAATPERLARRLDVAQQLCGAVAVSVRRRLCVSLLLTVYRHYLTIQGVATQEGHARAGLRAAVTALDAGCRSELADSAIAATHDLLQPDGEELKSSKIEQIVSLSLELLPEDIDESEMLNFSERLLDLKSPSPKTSPEVFALRVDCIYGDLNCPLDDDDYIKQVIADSRGSASEFTKEDLLLYVHKSLYRAFCLNHILSRIENGDAKSWNSLLGRVFFKHQIVQVVYDCALLSSLEERYAFWPHFNILKQANQEIKKSLEGILSKISNETKNVLLEHSSEQAAKRGYYWSYARKLLQIKISQMDNVVKNKDGTHSAEGAEITEENSNSKSPDVSPQKEQSSESYENVLIHGQNYEDIITGSGYFHNLQAECKYSGYTMNSRFVVMLRSAAAAHAHDAPLLAALLRAAPARDFDYVIDAYYQHNHFMLFERDLTDAPWAQVVSNAAVLDYLGTLVAENAWGLSALRWDFINIAVCSILASVRLSNDNLGCLKVAILARPALALARQVHTFVAGVRARAEREQPSEHVLALPTEWKDIFAPDLSASVAQLVMKLLQLADKSMSASLLALVDGLVPLMRELQWVELPAGVRTTLAPPQVVSAATDALQRVTHHTYSFLAYFTLEFMADALVDDDRDKLAAWSARGDDSERPGVWPAHLEPARCHLHTLLEAALSSVRVGEDVCHVVPFSDSHAVALASLLLTVALHNLAARAEGDLHIVYIDHFREHGVAEDALSTSLRLLPVAAFAVTTEPRATLTPQVLSLFTDGPHYQVGGGVSDAVEALACRSLLLALGGAGSGGARSWAAARPPVLQALRRLVPIAVAPPLIAAHLRRLQERTNKLPDAQVSIKWSVGEVTCSLGVEEHVLELVVQMAPDHPLTPPTVTTSANSPVPDTLWLSLYLGHQNGTLENAMRMWIKSVTGRVENASQCFICYCRMHPKSGHLPTMPCHQCRNRFHSACVRKWISTSGKSICPICRTHF